MKTTRSPCTSASPHRRRPWPYVLAIMTLVLLASLVGAQVGGGFDLTWWSIDGGGGEPATGGTYELIGVIGQPEAALATGGEYTLEGGFLQSEANQPQLGFTGFVIK